MFAAVLVVTFLSASLALVTAHQIPIIDIGALVASRTDPNFCIVTEETVNKIDSACRNIGFFYVINHGVPISLIEQLEELSSEFFRLDVQQKKEIDMKLGGKAWRGYFAVGDELTSGIPDQKEGIYFGTELADYSGSKPLHGKNIWLNNELGAKMKESVLQYMGHMKELGQLLMKGITCSLHLNEHHFGEQFANPTELFRIFNYPPHNASYGEKSIGVGEHTDYGYITILKQDSSVIDDVNGLQVKDVMGSWINAPVIPNSFIINLGDALEHNTQGLYKATPHRVLQRTGARNPRITMPYFFDPSFDSPMQSIVPFLRAEDQAIIEALKASPADAAAQRRWDKMDPSLFQGTYGEYLLKKVSRAFPDLFAEFVAAPVGSAAASAQTVVQEKEL